MKDDIGLILEEDWKKAEGVLYTGNETNSSLTNRDYSKGCRTPRVIAAVKGYYIRWCSVHHQPVSYCYSARDKLAIVESLGRIREEILRM